LKLLSESDQAALPDLILLLDTYSKDWIRLDIRVCFFEASGSRLEKRVKTGFFSGWIVSITGRACPEVVRE
jgi:hypothetical protein